MIGARYVPTRYGMPALQQVYSVAIVLYFDCSDIPNCYRYGCDVGNQRALAVDKRLDREPTRRTGSIASLKRRGILDVVFVQ